MGVVFSEQNLLYAHRRALLREPMALPEQRGSIRVRDRKSRARELELAVALLAQGREFCGSSSMVAPSGSCWTRERVSRVTKGSAETCSSKLAVSCGEATA